MNKNSYRSQWGQNARSRVQDCGQTCVEMLLAEYGLQIPADALIVGKQMTTAMDQKNELNKYLAPRGIVHSLFNPIRLEDIVLPAICAVRYGYLTSRMDKFTGWHSLIIVAVDSRWVTTFDPDYWGKWEYLGAGRAYSRSEFDVASICPAEVCGQPVRWTVEPRAGGREITTLIPPMYEAHEAEEQEGYRPG